MRNENYTVKIETIFGTTHTCPSIYNNRDALKMAALYRKDGYFHLYGEIKKVWIEKI